MWSPLVRDGEPLSQSPTWRPEPLERGTWTILSSCLITLSLCVWSALHLNIPEHGKTGSQFWRRTKWLLIGLFGPEIVALQAIGQWQKARSLGENVNGNLPNTSKDKKWVLTHGFFGIMGGFAFDTANSMALPDGRTRLVLTPQAILWLAKNRPDLIPDLSASQIKDKSKANHFAKVIICLQASFFIANFISRLCLGFAVTLLELNTTAHVFCALVTYVTWWNKPLDVEEPVLIQLTDEEAASICSAMFLTSEVVAKIPVVVPEEAIRACRFPWLARFLAKQVKAKLKLVPLDIERFERPVVFIPSNRDTGKPTIPEMIARKDRPDPGARLAEIFSDTGPMILLYPYYPENKGFRVELGTWQDMCYMLLDIMTEDHWHEPGEITVQVPISQELLFLRKLAAQTQHGMSILEGSFNPYGESAGGNKENYRIFRHEGMREFFAERDQRHQNWVVSRQRNWSRTEYQKARFTIATPLNFVPLFYDAWHLMAWNGPFIGPTHEILWRISAVALSASVIAHLLTIYLSIGASHIGGPRVFKSLAFFVIWVASVGAFLLLTFSRFYITIAAFMSLPYSPDSAFQTPNWALYFPHLA